MTMMRALRAVTATIAAAGTESAAIDLENFAVIGLILPTQDTANITFKVSDKIAGTYVLLKDKDGGTITITATTGGFAVGSDDLAPLAAYRYIKVVSSAAQTTAEEYIFMLKG